MNKVIDKARELLTSGEADLFIGYEQGSSGPRPYFASTPEEAENLIYNEKCTGNLAVYLTRKDITGGKKTGIFASYHTLKSICLLYDENQINEDKLKITGLVDNDIRQFENIGEIRQYIEKAVPPPAETDEELTKKIDAMTAQERWEFWTGELAQCFKCYACRAACPMCYCTKCIVEVNRPQWIQPWAATAANMEWQISRVMHMAGRCSGCGACGTACPLGLPVHILSYKMAEMVKEHFGQQTGKGNVLSTFKPDDKENFIL